MALDHGWIVSVSGIRARGDESLARIVAEISLAKNSAIPRAKSSALRAMFRKDHQRIPNYWILKGFPDELAEDLTAFDAGDLDSQRLIRPTRCRVTTAKVRPDRGWAGSTKPQSLMLSHRAQGIPLGLSGE